MVSQPAGTVTLLFTDVEGSTRLLEQLGTAGYAQLLEQHRELLRNAFARHEDYEFGTEGWSRTPRPCTGTRKRRACDAARPSVRKRGTSAEEAKEAFGAELAAALKGL